MEDPFRRTLALLALGATLGAASPTEDEGALAHYRHAAFGGAVGSSIGLGFGFLATAQGNGESFEAAMVTGILGGYLVGSSFFANTVSPWHEANGSFGLDLLGAAGAGAATLLFGEWLASSGAESKERKIQGWSALATLATVPLGAVLAQRLVAGSPSSLSAWHPSGTSPETVGVLACWSFR